ncbi:MAG: hypothetical protein HQL51_09100 [Magnetococcales bacterium]|nr:hypothetical protein [Magnetococcales bacterium]
MSGKNCSPGQRGVATLGISLTMLLVITLGAIFTAHVVRQQQRVAANEYRAVKAAEAAEAGLEWGLAQLGDPAFYATVIVDKIPADGWVDANAQQAPAGLLPADVGFQVSFANPTANNLKRLTVTSIGCADGCSPCTQACPIRRRVQGQIQLGSSLFPKALRAAVIAKNKVSLTLNAKVTNLYSNQAGSDLTVWSGNTTVYSNGSGTVNVGGSYNTATSDPTTRPNDATLAAASTEQFFQMFFSVASADARSALPNIACGSTCNAQLNGVVGQALWITTNLVLNGANTIGSPTQPVILITPRDCQISDSNLIYGVVYCNNLTGSGTATKVSTVYGGVVVQNDYIVTKVPDVVYDANIMSRLVSQFGGGLGGGGGRIPGSWRDFP